MCATPARHRAARVSASEPKRGFWAPTDSAGGSPQNGTPRHQRRDVPKYRTPIGRVGALAVSLGVGLAVANSAGLARADIDPDSSVSSTGPESDDTSAESRVDAQQSSNENEEEESDDEEKVEENAGESGIEELTEGDDTLVEADADTDEPADELGQQNPDVLEAEPVEETPPPSAEEQTADGIPAEPIAEPSTPDNHPGASGEVPDASNVTRSDDEVAPEPLSDAAVTDGLEPTADPSLLISARTTTMSTDLAPDPTVPVMATVAPAEESVETVDLVSALVSTVVSPFADPNAPAPTPWFDALLAWVRRQIVHTFFNESPVWGPIESTQIVTCKVLVFR